MPESESPPLNGNATNREYLQSIHHDAKEALRVANEAKTAAEATNTALVEFRNRLFGYRADPTDNGALGAIRDDLRNFIARHDADEEAQQTAKDKERDEDADGRRFRRNFLLAICTLIVVGMGVVAGIVIPVVTR